MKKTLLSLEQYYINLLEPGYNIAKIAYSLLGTKRSKEQRILISTNITEKQIIRIQQLNLGKSLNLET